MMSKTELFEVRIWVEYDPDIEIGHDEWVLARDILAEALQEDDEIPFYLFELAFESEGVYVILSVYEDKMDKNWNPADLREVVGEAIGRFLENFKEN